MVSDLSEEREQAHLLLDVLPDDKVAAVRSLLEVMVEPKPVSFADAAYEDEETTPEMSARLAKARESIGRGDLVSHGEVLTELGL